MANSLSWKKIVEDYKILEHDFKHAPFTISANQIKKSCQNFVRTGEKEVRILCKQDTRESRPQVFKENNLFLLPIKNGFYSIIKGEGYVDIPDIITETEIYRSKLDFELETSKIGNSEMQHIDFVYATSLLRTFIEDPTLVLTIRGRKYTPKFIFFVNGQKIEIEGVQTEVDGGYEGVNQLVLVEAKPMGTKNIIIRQLYYPFRQWQIHANKKVITLFFEKDTQNSTYSFWKFEFERPNQYESIRLTKSAKYKII